MRSLILGLCLIVSSIGSAAEKKYSVMSGCLDCFNFVAPSFAGAEAITAPEIGLVVYDTNFSRFRGYTGSGWYTIGREVGVSTKTSTYTATYNDDLLLSNASGALTFNLPAAASSTGKLYRFKNINATGAVTIDPNASETVDGDATLSLAKENDSVAIASDGTNWNVVASRIAPSITVLTSGSGTYTTPVGTLYLKVKLVGGGGSGAGGGQNGTASNGSAGNSTTFGSFTAGGGGAGIAGGAGSGGAGGTNTFSGTGFQIPGGGGGGNGSASGSAARDSGGMGGNSVFGGGGKTAYNTAGGAGATNSGAGGGGGGNESTSGISGTGGGAGGYVEGYIMSPASSYSYGVAGAQTSVGSAGTAGYAGGQGAQGILIIEAHYQ